MNTILWLAFFASAALFLIGKMADYRNSKGRAELNATFQDGTGMFDAKKFKREALILFVLIFGGAAVAGYILSPYLLAIAIIPFTFLGVQGLRLSRQ